jgi:hypothetical protein
MPLGLTLSPTKTIAESLSGLSDRLTHPVRQTSWERQESKDVEILDAPPAVDGHVRSCLFRLPAGLADGFGPEDEPYASSKTAMRFTPSTGSPAFPLGSSACSKSIAYKAGKVKHRWDFPRFPLAGESGDLTSVGFSGERQGGGVKGIPSIRERSFKSSTRLFSASSGALRQSKGRPCEILTHFTGQGKG